MLEVRVGRQAYTMRIDGRTGLIFLFCLFVTGCTDDAAGTLYGGCVKEDTTEINASLGANQEDLSCWEGIYTFFESDQVDDGPYLSMDYNLCVYSEDGKYYADFTMDGHLTAKHLRAQVYGDEEWVSFVFLKELEGNAFSWDESKGNTVLFSLRRENDVIYTYWGDIAAQVYKDNQISGRVYWEKVEE